jgi:hypothetical protein
MTDWIVADLQLEASLQGLTVRNGSPEGNVKMGNTETPPALGAE